MENKSSIISQKLSPTKTFIESIKNTFKNSIFNSDIGFLILIISIFIIISIGSIFTFENLDLIRYKFVNNTIGIIGSIVLIFIIYQYTGKNAQIMNNNIDIGYIMYVIIILGLFLLFSG